MPVRLRSHDKEEQQGSPASARRGDRRAQSLSHRKDRNSRPQKGRPDKHPHEKATVTKQEGKTGSRWEVPERQAEAVPEPPGRMTAHKDRQVARH